MANIGSFKFKRSKVKSKKPTTAQLGEGELALNLLDKKIYTNDGSKIVELTGWKDGVLVTNWKDKFVNHGTLSANLTHSLASSHTFKFTLSADRSINVTDTLAASECAHWDVIFTTGGFTPTFKFNNIVTILPTNYDISTNATYIASFLGTSSVSYLTGIQEMS